jgi:hypothetical protein
MGISLIMATVIATTAGSGCSWAHPGANPYRGAPPAALADFSMPAETRRQLQTLMATQRYTDIVTITRDGIVGQGRYGDLREMHSGHGQLCHGPVDRSAWTAAHEERGLVYCVGETCVIVPTVCNNVSLVTRKPAEGPLESGADEQIDISPAAGPPPSPPADVPVAQSPDIAPLDFIPVASAPGLVDSLDGGGEGPVGGAGSGSGSGSGGAAGGVISCCGTAPVGPVAPAAPPVAPTSPVPETPTWALLLAGAALLAAVVRRQRGSGAA